MTQHFLWICHSFKGTGTSHDTYVYGKLISYLYLKYYKNSMCKDNVCKRMNNIKGRSFIDDVNLYLYTLPSKIKGTNTFF